MSLQPTSAYIPTLRTTMSEMNVSDEFRAKLERLSGARPRYEQSAARVRVHETFDAIKAAKARGITWQAIADLMNADGLRATDGAELTASHVAALYTSEKNARGEKKKRRTKKPTAAPTTPASAPAPLDTPEDEPSRKFVLPKTTRK